MDPKPLIDTVAPTPFGWVVTTQNDFDLPSILAFRNQLTSLSRALGVVTAQPVSSTAAGAEVLETVEVNRPVHAA